MTRETKHQVIRKIRSRFTLSGEMQLLSQILVRSSCHGKGEWAMLTAELIQSTNHEMHAKYGIVFLQMEITMAVLGDLGRYPAR